MEKPNRIIMHPLDYKKRDLILIFPGGGYERTSSRESEPVAEAFNALGYHAAVFEYRNQIVLHPDIVPRALEEINNLRRIKYVSNIILCGFSAGGHLVMSILEEKMKWFKAGILAYPVVTTDPRYRHESSFRALLGDDMSIKRLREVSVDRHVRTSLPPIFIWTTMDDGSVPIENSILLMEALKKKGVPVEAHFFPKGRHGLSLATEATPFEGDSDPEAFARENRHVATWLSMVDEWIKSL